MKHWKYEKIYGRIEQNKNKWKFDPKIKLIQLKNKKACKMFFNKVWENKSKVGFSLFWDGECKKMVMLME